MRGYSHALTADDALIYNTTADAGVFRARSFQGGDFAIAGFACCRARTRAPRGDFKPHEVAGAEHAILALPSFFAMPVTYASSSFGGVARRPVGLATTRG